MLVPVMIAISLTYHSVKENKKFPSLSDTQNIEQACSSHSAVTTLQWKFSEETLTQCQADVQKVNVLKADFIT